MDVAMYPNAAQSQHMQGIAAVALAMVMSLLAPVRANADFTESFESPDKSWQVATSDCPRFKVEVHERVWGEARSGKRSEHFRIRANGGAYCYVTMDVPPSRIINEFDPRLWVKANRPGVQFLLRVVLPRSIDPKTGKPLTTLLPGDFVEHPDVWSPLSVPNAKRLLDQAVPRLRREFGSFVDGREAFVDKLVINAYGGPGSTQIWIDDVRYPIYAPMAITDPAVRPAQAQLPASRPVNSGDAPRARGDLLVVEGRPFLARAIEHNGEPFSWLKGIGFNTILLQAPASSPQLLEAAQAGVWLVAPPPPHAITQQHDRILAWRLGEQLTDRDVEAIRNQSRDLRRRDPSQGRPLYLGAATNAWDFRRSADVFVIDRDVLGSKNELSDMGRYWKDAPEQNRLAGPIWASIPTQLSPSLHNQVIAHQAGASLQFAYVEPDQMRAMTYHAAASGVRGFVFRSGSPLDREDTATRMRAKTLELLNHELTLVEPWIAGGVCEGDLDTNDPRLRASVLRTERSQLLMATRQAQHQQFVMGSLEREDIGLTMSSISTSAEAYRLTFTTLQPVRSTRVPGGFRIQLSDAEITSLILLTQNPRVMEHVGRTLLEHGPTIAHLRYELTEMHWDRTRRVLERLAAIGSALPQWGARLQESRVRLDQCRDRIQANDYDWAVSLANSASKSLAQLRRGHWDQAVGAFPTPQSAPLCADFALLPEHWGLSQRMRRGYWSGNALPAGGFENLEHMLQVGWAQKINETANGNAMVELSLSSPHSGRRALRLTASPGQGLASPNAQRPRVTITSAPIAIQQGQIARIHGWVRTEFPIPQGGRFTIYDSLAGPGYGDSVVNSPGWREFTLYRAAPRRDYLLVHFDLEGEGEVFVDDLTVSLLQTPETLPGPGSRPSPSSLDLPSTIEGPELAPPSASVPRPSSVRNSSFGVGNSHPER